MTTAAKPFPLEWSLEDLLKHLGGISAGRVRLSPTPGTAVEQDVLHVRLEQGKLCELIDGVLVEKTMGFVESRLAVWIGHLLQKHLGDDDDTTEIAGADGALRLMPGLVRIPDLCVIRVDRLPDRSVI